MEEILARGGNPELVCSAMAEAIDIKPGSSMSLQAVIMEAQKGKQADSDLSIENCQYE